MQKLKEALFRRKTEFKVVKNEGETESSPVEESLEQPIEAQTEEAVNPLEELKPLMDKWRQACFDNAQAGYVNFTLLKQDGEPRAFFVLERILAVGGDILTLIRDDMLIWRCKRTVVTNPAGFVSRIDIEWQPIVKPQELGITPEKIVNLVHSVVRGETPQTFKVTT